MLFYLLVLLPFPYRAGRHEPAAWKKVFERARLYKYAFLVLGTVWFAARGNFTRHPQVARWTLPIWLYVSVSGVVVYLLAFHVYRPEGM